MVLRQKSFGTAPSSSTQSGSVKNVENIVSLWHYSRSSR